MAGLEDLYREIILDHYRSPRNRGELETPPAVKSEGFNPLCGDEIVIYLSTDGDTISDIRIGGQGCSISQSSASMMSAAVKGKSLAEVSELTASFKAMMSIHEPPEAEPTDGAGAGREAAGALETEAAAISPEAQKALGDIAALQGVVKFPVRIKCATLSWNTLAEAIGQATAESEAAG